MQDQTSLTLLLKNGPLSSALQVVVPPDVTCCGFAGDKGIFMPELNRCVSECVCASARLLISNSRTMVRDWPHTLQRHMCTHLHTRNGQDSHTSLCHISKYRSALKTLPDAVRGCTQGVSNSRTCEIGLTRSSGLVYESLFYLLERQSTRRHEQAVEPDQAGTNEGFDQPVNA